VSDIKAACGERQELADLGFSRMSAVWLSKSSDCNPAARSAKRLTAFDPTLTSTVVDSLPNSRPTALDGAADRKPSELRACD